MIALYVRVSVSDRARGSAGPDAQADSLAAQEAELRHFVSSRDDLVGEVRVFADDGISGRREDRVAFNEMLELAMRGQVSCVVVRDLSRLARNYVLAGRVLFQTLPSAGVRVVSVEDGYDSLKPGDAANERLLWSMVGIMNEGYCYMVSERVRASVRMLWSHGKRFGANAPYGFVYDKQADGYLRIDPVASRVVRLVFARAAAGVGPTAIARELNASGVCTPAEYRRVLEGRSAQAASSWDAAKVSAILRREAYKGTLVAGVATRTPVGSASRVRCPEESWVRVERAHEAIVSDELFAKAQRVLRPRKATA